MKCQVAQNGTHKNAKEIFFNDLYTNTKPKAPDTNLTPGIANIKGYPLALLYPNWGPPPSFPHIGQPWGWGVVAGLSKIKDN